MPEVFACLEEHGSLRKIDVKLENNIKQIGVQKLSGVESNKDAINEKDVAEFIKLNKNNERLIQQKRSNTITIFVGIIGVLLSLFTIIVSFNDVYSIIGRYHFENIKSKSDNSVLPSSREELLEKLVASQNETIILLRSEIARMKEDKPNANKLKYYRNDLGNITSPAQYILAGEIANNDQNNTGLSLTAKNRDTLRYLVFPVVYGAFVFLLIISSFSCIFVKEEARRTIALEIARTLITFLTGAMTGLV